MNKVILLDIDGVIAPLGRIEKDDYSIIDLDGWSTIAVPNENLIFIKDLKKLIEIIWSSSWEKTSNKICEKANLENFNYLKFPNTQQDYWNKLPVIIEFINNNVSKEILLLDDEIDSYSYNLINQYENVSIINIEPIQGLTEANKKKVFEWIKS